MERRAVLLVENESVPTDKRVWSEALILKDAGYVVTVVCPVGLGRDLERRTEIDGIDVRRFPLTRASGGLFRFVIEYLTALVRMSSIVWQLDGPIAVVHSANPPDFLFLVGLVPKLRWGTKLVFDHHDLVPELFESRFGKMRTPLLILKMVERLNFAAADAVISTNESYRRLAIERGGKRPDQVRVVRNARDRSSFVRIDPDPALRRGKEFLAVYVGVMGPQDGADWAVRAVAEYRHTLGRNDLHVSFVGDGDDVPRCKELASELGVADIVDFPGWQEFNDVLRYLSTADIGLASDPPSPLNDRSTMIKVVEYLALGLPVVSFDLPESMVTAGDAALYSAGGDDLGMARNIARLLDEPALRREMSELAMQRNTGPLSWEVARDELLATYRHLEGSGV